MADKTKAKLHTALSRFKEEVKKGFIEKTVTISDTTFTLHTPTEDEEVWADTYTRPTTPLSYLSSRRAPRLSVAIKKVNGVAIDDLFTLEDGATDEEKDRLKDPQAKRYWLYLQLMAFLASDVPPPVMEKIYSEYEDLLKERDTSLKAATDESPNSKTKTPGSTSEAT
jgi:hypothetical protein